MQKTLILGSNRGGIPEMLQKGRGYVADILNYEQILEVLEKIYKLKEEDYREIVENAYHYIKKNNSFNQYTKKIVEVIEG